MNHYYALNSAYCASAIKNWDFSSVDFSPAIEIGDCVREYKTNDLSPPPDLDPSAKSEFILSVAREEDGMVLVLDLESLLSASDYKVLKDQQTKKAG